jgi:hypothetical protein
MGLTSISLPRPVVCAIAGAICLVVATGCAGRSPRDETKRVEAVVGRWIAAERAGDGRTWCDQLSTARLAKEEQNIFNATGRRYSCAEMHSTRPPGIPRLDLYTRARREVTEGFRIERTTIAHNKATVRFSWLASRQPNPLISHVGDTREGDRWASEVSLVLQHGSWKIGRS